MKTKAAILGATLLSVGAKASEANLMTVQELEHRGVSPKKAMELFESEQGVLLTLSDLVKVSYDEEGNGIRLENIDHISVVVPFMEARPTGNKTTGVGGF